MLTVMSRMTILALSVAGISACTPNPEMGDPGMGTPSSPGMPMGNSTIGLPPEMQACSTGLQTPGCDQKAAGKALAGMSESQDVLSNFRSPTVARMTMRFTADGMRYGTDVVSCDDINSQQEAFNAAVHPGAAADLGAFITTISADQARLKGCS